MLVLPQHRHSTSFQSAEGVLWDVDDEHDCGVKDIGGNLVSVLLLEKRPVMEIQTVFD